MIKTTLATHALMIESNLPAPRMVSLTIRGRRLVSLQPEAEKSQSFKVVQESSTLLFVR